jgi:hypothetical protein
VIKALAQELAARRRARAANLPEFCRVGVGFSRDDDTVNLAELEGGSSAALQLASADWILVPSHLRDRVSRFIPADAMCLDEVEPQTPRAYRARHWHRQHGDLARAVQDRGRRYSSAAELAHALRGFIREETWAGQVAWRVGRVHQLATAANGQQRARRQAEVDALMPRVADYDWVPVAVSTIRDVGVRSVIEALRVGREDGRARRPSALTDAIPPAEWTKRSVRLSFQHRMHPDISRLPRETFYEAAALRDANTLSERDSRMGWSFASDAPSRRVWVDVRGEESRGSNPKEIAAMRRWLEAWRDHATLHPRADGRPWEVALLSCYNKQELATRDMLREVTGKKRGETRFELPNTTLACATVDRFQGREADLVLLSMRNTKRPGHMDSPNRLNVAITRGRFMLAIFGHHGYFATGPSDELAALAKNSPLYDLGRHP